MVLMKNREKFYVPVVYVTLSRADTEHVWKTASELIFFISRNLLRSLILTVENKQRNVFHLKTACTFLKIIHTKE